MPTSDLEPDALAPKECEFGVSYASRETAIQILASFFQALAIVPAVIGFLGIAGLFRPRPTSPLADLLGEWSRDFLLPGRVNGVEFLLPVGVPVVVAVLCTWLCFTLGVSLKRRLPWARWTAVFLLALVCIPILTFAILACWGRDYATAIGASVIAAVPMSLALLLSAATSDILFAPGSREFVGNLPLRCEAEGEPLGLSYKLGLLGLSFVVLMILAFLAQ